MSRIRVHNSILPNSNAVLSISTINLYLPGFYVVQLEDTWGYQSSVI